MKVFIAFVLLALSLVSGGCSAAGGYDSNQPIVSPTNISDTDQEDGEPILPHLIPWWAKEK